MDRAELACLSVWQLLRRRVSAALMDAEGGIGRWRIESPRRTVKMVCRPILFTEGQGRDIPLSDRCWLAGPFLIRAHYIIQPSKL